jgi:hypothetical protein
MVAAALKRFAHFSIMMAFLSSLRPPWHQPQPICFKMKAGHPFQDIIRTEEQDAADIMLISLL